MKNKIKQILERETQGLNLNEKAKEFFRIFSYNDVERLMEELILVPRWVEVSRRIKMKLKTIFNEYEMPNEFWNRLEKIFEIETKEAYERGLKSNGQQENDSKKSLLNLQPADTENQIKKEIDKDYEI